jgi:hypothetical protein
VLNSSDLRNNTSQDINVRPNIRTQLLQWDKTYGHLRIEELEFFQGRPPPPGRSRNELGRIKIQDHEQDNDEEAFIATSEYSSTRKDDVDELHGSGKTPMYKGDLVDLS